MVLGRLGHPKAIESSRDMERAMGIEPTSEAWEASILPLNYARWALSPTKNSTAI